MYFSIPFCISHVSIEPVARAPDFLSVRSGIRQACLYAMQRSTFDSCQIVCSVHTNVCIVTSPSRLPPSRGFTVSLCEPLARFCHQPTTSQKSSPWMNCQDLRLEISAVQLLRGRQSGQLSSLLTSSPFLPPPPPGRRSRQRSAPDSPTSPQIFKLPGSPSRRGCGPRAVTPLQRCGVE